MSNTTTIAPGHTPLGHTPGPWHRNIKPASRYRTIYAGRNTHVASLSTSGLTEDKIEGNCNLIAAAPELLAALKNILTCRCDDVSFGTACPCILEAETIIMKAEGVRR